MSTNANSLPLPGTLVGGADASRDGRSRGWSVRVLACIGGVLLLTLVAGSLLIVLVAADRPSFLAPTTNARFFPSWLAGPLGGLLPELTQNRNILKYLFTLSVGAMYVCYLLALVCVPRMRARWAIAAVVAVHIVFFLSPPLSLTDIFNYINYGRMEIVQHLNPYATIPVLEPHNDPSFVLSNWHHLLSPYGPLFTLLTFAVVPLGVAASFWTLKAVLMLASLGSLFLVWRCAELLGRDPVRALVFVGLNPLVLVWGLGGDHNDFIMVFFIMLGLYLLLRAQGARAQDAGPSSFAVATPGNGIGPAPAQPITRPALSSAVLRATASSGDRGTPAGTTGADAPGVVNGGGAHAAMSAAAVLPADGAAGERIGGDPGATQVLPSVEVATNGTDPVLAHPGAPQRRARLLGWLLPLSPLEIAGGAALVTAVFIKASAGILVPVVLCGSLASPRRLVQVLLGMATAAMVLGTATYIAFGAHIPDLTTQAKFVIAVGLPNLLGLALGLGGETTTLHTVLSATLLGAVLLASLWAWRRSEWITAAGWATVALVVTLSWVLPWYVLWTLPLAALGRSRVQRGVVLVLGVYLILAWVPLMTDLIHAVGFKPSATPLGQLHQRVTKDLLR